MIKLIQRYFKMRRLIKKYTLTDSKIRDDLRMIKIWGDEPGFMEWLSHNRICEARCLMRLRKLSS